MKHFISIHDISHEEFNQLLSLAAKLKKEQKTGVTHHILKGKTLAMIFTKSSTRTRVSFETGIYQLGGQALFLSANDIQLGRGETIYDTAKVMSRFVDGIMIRTFDHQDVLDLAKYGSIPIINGLTDLLHPCQALADLMTVKEHKGRLRGLKLAYIGDGNNVAHSLLYACAKAGMDISVGSPKGYECDPEIVANAREDAKALGSKIVMTNDPVEAITDADVVYTDTWASMGQESEKEKRVKAFQGYQIDLELFNKSKPDSIFMHCLPAYRGFEMTADVIDGERSVVFDEAENRLHAQKAVMAMLMVGDNKNE